MDNKRIVKNTILLYLRMFISMCINLYTSRLVLNTLGVEDYGIYNVVAGLVIIFGFLNSAMSASSQRFLTFEQGRNDSVRLNQVFKISMLIHVGIVICMILMAETIGLWFVNTQLVIPSGRLTAANYIYQFSIATLGLTILCVPYNAVIVAREKMGAIAVIGLLEVCLKFIGIYILQFFQYDKLVYYGLILFVIAILIRIIYRNYCIYHFPEAHYSYYWNRKLFKSMSSFAGWNLIGVFAGMAYNQGVNILLNIFAGPLINAARAIAFQVNGSINQLVTNFQLAANPSIIKLYVNRAQTLYSLVFAASKYSYIILLFLIIPLFIECKYILGIWLHNVPEYSVVFTRLVMIDIIIGSLSGSLHTLVQATGRIRTYQIVISGLLLLNLPISYLFLKIGKTPEITFWVSIILSFCSLFARLIIISRLTNLSISRYLSKVILPIVLITFIVPIIPFDIYLHMHDSFLRLLYIIITSSVILSGCVWLFAMTKQEKTFVANYVRRFFS